MADLLRKTTSLFSTTSNSFGTGSSETITLNSVSGLPTDTEITLTFDRVDSSGTATPSKVERIIGTISGSNLVIRTSPSSGRGADSTTEQAHTSPVVEYIPNAKDINDMVDHLLTGHTQAGLHDFNGGEVTIDADADTTMTADTDDQIDWKLGGSDRFRMKTSDFDIVTATGNIQVAGADPKRGMYVPAAGMFAATTSGAASAQLETSTNKVNLKVFDFDKDSDESVHFALPSPLYWDASTVTATPFWTTSAATSGVVVWGVQGMSFANDDALDQAYGTAQTSSDTFLAQGDVHIGPTTSAITIGGTPTAGDWVQFKIYRDADNGSDTLNGDARLIGVRITFGIAQYSDV